MLFKFYHLLASFATFIKLFFLEKKFLYLLPFAAIIWNSISSEMYNCISQHDHDYSISIAVNILEEIEFLCSNTSGTILGYHTTYSYMNCAIIGTIITTIKCTKQFEDVWLCNIKPLCCALCKNWIDVKLCIGIIG